MPNAPNILTLARLALAPLLIWLLFTGRMPAALLVLAFAASTDAADGYLARRYGWQSELGAVLDAFSDKLILVGTYVALGYQSLLPAWLVVLVIVRDALVVAVVILQSWLSGTVRVRPLMSGKINTAAQVTLAILVIADEALGLGLDAIRPLLCYAVAATTVLSAFAYLKAWHGARNVVGSGDGGRGAMQQ